MAVPLQTFTSCRAALESVRGTNLTPTRIIYGESFTLEHGVKLIRPKELRASYEAYYQVAAGPEVSALTITGRVSYDDIIWWLNLALKAVASGVGGGADKTWTFLPTNTVDDVKTVTVQLGDSQAISAATPGVQLNYGMLDTLNIHWEKNDDGAATFTSRILFAKALTQITAFTGALSDRTTTPVSCNNTVVDIDTTTIGTTPDPSVTAIDWTLNNYPVPFYGLDGTLAAQAVYRPHPREWTAQITRQYTSVAEFNAYVAKTIRKVRIDTHIGAGTSYKLQMDLYGTYDEGRTYNDVDGIITEVLPFVQVYDTASTSSVNAVVINQTGAIT